MTLSPYGQGGPDLLEVGDLTVARRVSQRRATRPLRCYEKLLFTSICLSLAVACDRQLTREEKLFHERAEKIETGATLELVKRQLGEPARVVDPGPTCLGKGGQKEWVYDSSVPRQLSVLKPEKSLRPTQRDHRAGPWASGQAFSRYFFQRRFAASLMAFRPAAESLRLRGGSA